jgi:hypothetical protein
MDNIQLAKIKAIILFLVSLFISYLGWLAILPAIENEPMTILSHGQPVKVILIALALVIVCGTLGHFFGSIEKQSLGLFAIPAAFCFWILQSGGSSQLLERLPGIEQRAELFHRFIPEVILWTLLFYTGFGLVALISRSKNPANKKPPKNKKVQLWKNPRVVAPSVLLANCLIAIILLKIFMRSGQTWTQGSLGYQVTYGPAKGQVLFALFASFYLATFITKYLYKVPLPLLLAAPALVAILSYLCVAQNHLPQDILDRAPAMILPSIRFGIILPIEFLTFGSLAVICGFWAQFPKQDYQ